MKIVFNSESKNVDKIRDEFEDQLAAARSTYAKSLNERVQAHEAEVKQIKHDNELAVAKLKSDHEKKVSEYEVGLRLADQQMRAQVVEEFQDVAKENANLTTLVAVLEAKLAAANDRIDDLDNYYTARLDAAEKVVNVQVADDSESPLLELARSVVEKLPTVSLSGLSVNAPNPNINVFPTTSAEVK